jgi:hypothetical protein
LLIVRLLQ